MFISELIGTKIWKKKRKLGCTYQQRLVSEWYIPIVFLLETYIDIIKYREIWSNIVYFTPMAVDDLWSSA